MKAIHPTFASAARGTDDPGRAADLVASMLNLAVAEAQRLLELYDSLQRLGRANQLLEAKYQMDRVARLQDQPRSQSS